MAPHPDKTSNWPFSIPFKYEDIRGKALKYKTETTKNERTQTKNIKPQTKKSTINIWSRYSASMKQQQDAIKKENNQRKRVTF